MNPRELVESSHPNTTLRELSAGANSVFRVINEDGSSIIVKVYPVPSRERRERRALESLKGTP
ncbi:MAG: hypothetical protein WEB67_12685, partial [Acidimicrobiia bacterium]